MLQSTSAPLLPRATSEMKAGASSPPDPAPAVDKVRGKSARKKIQEKSPSLSGINSAFSDAAQPGIVVQRKRKPSPAPNVQAGTIPSSEMKRNHRDAKGGNSRPDRPAGAKSPAALAGVDSNVPPDKADLAEPFTSQPTSLVTTPLSSPTSPTPPAAELEKAFTSARSTTPGKADGLGHLYRLSDRNGAAAPDAAVSPPRPAKSDAEAVIAVPQQPLHADAKKRSGTDVDKQLRRLLVTLEARDSQPSKHFKQASSYEQESAPPQLPGDDNKRPRRKSSKLVQLQETLRSKFAKKQEEQASSVVQRHSASASYYKSLAELASTLHTQSVVHSTERDRTRKTPKCPKNLTIIAVFVAVMLVVLLIVQFLGRSSLSNTNRGACATDICLRHAAFFRDSLNYSADPCVNFNAFACSRWKPTNDFSLDFSIDMTRTHMKLMSDLLLSGWPKFNASVKAAKFLRKCMEETENPDSLRFVQQYAKRLGIPWPYEPPTSGHGEHVHPLRVVFELSLKWGMYAWFSVALKQLPTSQQGMSAVFYIDTTSAPSEWLSFVHTLEENRARDSYYRHFCELYGVSVPEPAKLQRTLATEKFVLVTLDNARWADPREVGNSTTSEIKELTRNVTMEEWIDLVQKLTVNVTEPQAAHFYVTNMNLISAIDEIFYARSQYEIMEQLAWWFVQDYSLLGSFSALLVIAGSRDKAEGIKAVECYDIVAEKFGLLLNAESAASMFSFIERQQLSRFLKQLTELANTFTHLLPWNNEGERYVSEKFKRLLVTVWPDDMANMDAMLSLNYSKFLVLDNITEPSFLDYWIQVTEVLQGMNYYDYEWMQHRWLSYEGRLAVYEYWANRLTVRHPAMTAPLYYSNNTELLGANFGGLGAYFLSNLLEMFKLSVVDQDTKGQVARLLSERGIKLFLKARTCGSRYGVQVKNLIALETAWHALKLNVLTSGLPSRGGMLEIESFHQTRSFSDEQVFFLTYCRSRCSIRSSATCNDVLGHFGAFADAFQCKADSPMRLTDNCGMLQHVDVTFKNSSHSLA